MASLANGEAPDLLTTLWIAADCEKAIAPAMNQQMWSDGSIKINLDRLIHRSVHIIGPDSGIQACGDLGLGRMMEPMNILDHLEHALNRGPLKGRKLLVTAGPTHEPLDPVRYLANRSSGKMGFALAALAVKLGGSVTLISGPVNLETPSGVERVNVETANEMLNAVTHALEHTDVFIGAAAVCDVRPKTEAKTKLKKSLNDLSIIQLDENPDIIQYVSKHAQRPSIVVGFAAETELVIEYAKHKLVSKSLDLIVANSVANSEVFGKNDTSVTVIDQQFIEAQLFGTKSDVALQILNKVVVLLTKRI
jgi:phosphopantothenoylcysteine decarboxylase/phosphopantothenate--cysteine ligase